MRGFATLDADRRPALRATRIRYRREPRSSPSAARIAARRPWLDRGTGRGYGLIMRRRSTALFLALACLILALGAARDARADPLEAVPVDGRGGYRLEGRYSLLRDPGGLLDAAAAAERAASLPPAPPGIPNLGLTGDAAWLRFRLRARSAGPSAAYLSFRYPVADSVALYALRDGVAAELGRDGDSEPSPRGTLPSRHYIFPVALGPGEELTCLLRVRSSAGMSLPVALLSESELAHKDIVDALGYGFLFGSLAWVLLYLLASPRREPWLLWFCAYALAFGLHVAIRSGYPRLLLGGAAHRISNLANVAAISLLFYTGAAFFRSFLDLRGRYRFPDAVMAVLQHLALAFVPLAAVSPPAFAAAAVLVNLAGPAFSIATAYALWRRGSPNAGLFALGWLMPHGVAVADYLRVNGIIAGGGWEGILLPLSLGLSLLSLGWAVVGRRARDAELARVDALSGLANRRRFDEALREEWSRSRRQGGPLALLMIDIDDFKRFNDGYGHRAGDQRLREVAEILAASARRAGDLAARYGGEEFAVILPNAGLEEAGLAAERIREAVESQGPGGEPGGGRTTISVGVAARVPAGEDAPEDLVSEADEALYRAKAAGKNRVALADPRESAG